MSVGLAVGLVVVISVLVGFSCFLLASFLDDRQWKESQKVWEETSKQNMQYEEFIKQVAVDMGIDEAHLLDKNKPDFFNDYRQAARIFCEKYHNKGYKDALETKEPERAFNEPFVCIKLTTREVALHKYINTNMLAKEEYMSGYKRGHKELREKNY